MNPGYFSQGPGNAAVWGAAPPLRSHPLRSRLWVFLSDRARLAFFYGRQGFTIFVRGIVAVRGRLHGSVVYHCIRNSVVRYPSQRPPGREHIPLYPKGFIAIRIVQLVLSVLVLGLAAYGIAIIPTSGDVYITVVAIMTIITSIYHLICEYSALTKAYNYWAVLALDIFLVIMWLASFSLLASEVAILYNYYFVFSSYYLDDFSESSGLADTVPACLAAAAALGGVQLVLHVVSLAVHGVRLHRHRAAGLHCTPTQPTTSVPIPAGIHPPPGAEKFQGYPSPYPAQQHHLIPGYQPIPIHMPPQPYGSAPYPSPQPHLPQQAPMPMPMGMPMPVPMQSYYMHQGQVPIPMQPTGGSYPLPLQPQPGYYQQGPAVPLFAQTTGGSTANANVASPQPPRSEQVQVQPQTQQLGGTELANTQIQPPQVPQPAAAAPVGGSM